MDNLEPKKQEKKGVYYAFVCKFCKTVFTSVQEIIEHKLKEHVKKQQVPNSTKDQADSEGRGAQSDENTAPTTESGNEGKIDVALSSIGTEQFGVQIKSTPPFNAPPHATDSCTSVAISTVAQSKTDLQSASSPKQRKRFKRHSLNGHRCTQCSKLFDTASMLKRHTLRHILPFPCPQCTKRWSSAAQLKVHVDQVHTVMGVKGHRVLKPKKHPCPMCPFSSYSYKSLFVHKKQHGTQHQYKCADCTCTFTTQIGLSRHRGWSHQKTSSKLNKPRTATVKNQQQSISKIMCTLCSKRVSTRGGITAHRKLYHPSELPYFCTECSFTTKSPSMIWHHKRCHSVKSKFSCLHCTASYDTLRKANIHIRRVHPNCELLTTTKAVGQNTSTTISSAFTTAPHQHACNNCPKSFRFQCQLKKHSLVHTRTYNCEQCPQKFGNAHALRSHLSKFHKQKNSKNQTFRCPCCCMLLASESKFPLHLKIYHPQYKHYQCKECSFKAANQVALQRHSVIHRKAESVQSVPSYTSYLEFIKRKKHMNEGHSELKLHLTTQATCISNTVVSTHPKGSFTSNVSRDIEPKRRLKVTVKCRICSVTFPTRTSYEMHFSQKHHTEKPYRCDQCYATYSRYDKLKIHQAVHCGDSVGPNTSLNTLEDITARSVMASQSPTCTGTELSNTNKISEITAKEQLIFKCSECPKKFCSKAALMVHNHTFHSSVFTEME